MEYFDCSPNYQHARHTPKGKTIPQGAFPFCKQVFKAPSATLVNSQGGKSQKISQSTCLSSFTWSICGRDFVFDGKARIETLPPPPTR
jgi:hypothetical protein